MTRWVFRETDPEAVRRRHDRGVGPFDADREEALMEQELGGHLEGLTVPFDADREEALMERVPQGYLPPVIG